MKKFLSLMIGITMSICLFTGCGNNKKEEPKPSYAVGTRVDGVYKNESINLKYTPIENMMVCNNDELKAAEEEVKKQNNITSHFSEVNVEFMGGLQTDSPAVIEIVSFKLADTAKNTSEDEIIKDITKYSGNDQNTNQSQKIGDIEFRKIPNIKSNNLNMTLFSKKFGDYFVIIYSIAPDDETNNKLLAGFSKLSD